MKSGRLKAAWLALLISESAWIASGQSPDLEQPVPIASLKADSSPVGHALREIDDRHTGIRWLLTQDPGHPAGPGRLVPGQASSFAGSQLTSAPSARLLPAILTGDRLIVEESTARVDARLEAVALGSAQVGSHFNVRLLIGGKVVRVVALGPGRAALVPQTRPRP